jgi:pimeloyl-ACP methyl ester carboxylesterase
MKLYKSAAGEKAIIDSYDGLLARWGIDIEERDLDGSYGRTHVVMAGSASNPPLLLFHGVGDDSAIMWLYNAKELAKRFRIIAVDTMGAPGKSRPDERYGKGFSLAKWYGDVLDALGIEECFAAGVSYGCYHCQLLLLCYPERVKKVVGIAGYVAAKGYSGSKFHAIFRIMRHALPLAFMPTRKNFLRFGAKLMGPGTEKMFEDSEVAEHFILLQKHCRAQAQFNHNRKTFTREETDRLRGRSLFLAGSEDLISSFPNAKKALADLGMKLKVFEGAGHGLNMSRAREVEAEILGFCLGR